MPSVRDRVILLPRFTTLAGVENFDTQPMNVAAYESGEIAVWMGPLLGTGTVTAEFQESTDGVVWSQCGGSASSLVTPQTEILLTPEFSKAWMRLRMILNIGTGDSPIATVYAVGNLDKRRR